MWSVGFGAGSATRPFGIAAPRNGTAYVGGSTTGAIVGGIRGVEDACLRPLDRNGVGIWTDQWP